MRATRGQTESAVGRCTSMVLSLRWHLIMIVIRFKIPSAVLLTEMLTVWHLWQITARGIFDDTLLFRKHFFHRSLKRETRTRGGHQSQRKTGTDRQGHHISFGLCGGQGMIFFFATVSKVSNYHLISSNDFCRTQHSWLSESLDMDSERSTW